MLPVTAFPLLLALKINVPNQPTVMRVRTAATTKYTQMYPVPMSSAALGQLKKSIEKKVFHIY